MINSSSRNGDDVNGAVARKKQQQRQLAVPLFKRLALVPRSKSFALVLLLLGRPAAAAADSSLRAAGAGADAHGPQERAASETLGLGAGTQDRRRLLLGQEQGSPGRKDGGMTAVADNNGRKLVEDNPEADAG